jgi:sarcosine oxidase, subunit delta
MLLVTCPWCGQRDQSEFAYGGEAHVARPLDNAAMSDAQWGEYVFMRNNPKGVFAERWVHVSGCRRWFNAVRNTATDEFLGFYKPGEPRPDVTAEVPATPSGEPSIGSGNDAAKLLREAGSAPANAGTRV